MIIASLLNLISASGVMSMPPFVNEKEGDSQVFVGKFFIIQFFIPLACPRPGCQGTLCLPAAALTASSAMLLGS
ncbi:MAG: hypothetical protein IJS22_05525, partial [Lachnospiraceae bacterium]|nr:hypothetical protein [Lachnospiraceae bacterium]